MRDAPLAAPLATPLALFAAVLLAGCSDGGGAGGAGDGDGATHPPGHTGSLDEIPAPLWQVGQWWQLASEQSDAGFTHVVSGESATDWTMDTDSQDIAFFDARFDISFLGQVRKSDLAGSQGGDRVQFFQFPLSLDRTWTTTWDGAPITVTVVGLDAAGAELEARHANGTLYAKYTYDVDLAYFGEYAFYAPDGETVGFAATVTDAGTAFSGELVRWTLDTLFEAHEAVGGRSTNFVVEPGYDDLWIDLHLACPQQGAVSVTFGPPTGPAEERGFTATGPCPTQLDETSTVTAPATPEQWGVFLASAPPQNAFLDLVILGRTLSTFAVGEAP